MTDDDRDAPCTVVAPEGDDWTTELPIKRFYVPYAIEAVCPVCGQEVVKDLSIDYLSYPKPNRPMKVGLYCDDDLSGCGHQFDVRVRLKISLEAADL